MIQVTINLRAVLFGVVLLLVAAGVATPFAISLADDGPTGERVSEQRASLLGDTFIYQGRLDSAGVPANGPYDMQFQLYDAATFGAPIGAQQSGIIQVTNGLFTLPLNLGSGLFAGDDRWLEVKLRPQNVGILETLPRQLLSATPNALYAKNAGTAGSVNWANIDNKPATFADNVDNDTTYTAQSPLSLTGTTFGFDTTGCQANDIWKYTGATWSCDPDATPVLGAHNHFGETWTGSGPVGLVIDNATPGTPGIVGNSSGLGGTGIFGTGHVNGYGVLGTTIWNSLVPGNGGLGVVGRARKAASGSFPNQDVAQGLHGIGLYGETDVSDGVFGFSSAVGGRGVVGQTNAPGGTGVVGGGGATGTGVLGASVAGTGVVGSSTNGAGVRGTSSSDYGVHGSSVSEVGVHGSSSSGYGVVGTTDSWFTAGVRGNSAGSGVCNPVLNNCAGVLGVGYAQGAPGVLGGAFVGHGVLGRTSAQGVAGVAGLAATGNPCVQGSAATLCYGVIGSADTTPNSAGIGVMGIGTAAGLWGRASGLTAYAGLFDGGVVINGGTLSHQILPSTNNAYQLGTSDLRWTVVWSNAFSGASDLRLKKNIATLDRGLDAVMDLRPVSFAWQEGAGTPQIGLIAQEVEAVVPEVVKTGTDELQLKGIDYSKLVPVLIKAIQEQQAQIESLKPGGGERQPASEPAIANAASAPGAPAVAIIGETNGTAAGDWARTGAIAFFGLGLFAIAGALLRRQSEPRT